MHQLRTNSLTEFDGIPIVEKKDYLQGMDDLPKENIIKLILKDQSWIAIRPSGTEPKLKIYMGVEGTSLAHARHKLLSMKHAVTKHIFQKQYPHAI